MVGEVDVNEWAKVVQELLDSKTKSKKAPFARAVGVDVRTVSNWLDRAVAVRETNVRRVAETFDLNPISLLLRVGVLQSADLPYQPTDEEIDEEQRKVLETDLDDETKAEILQQLEEMRAADERLIVEQRERDKQRRMRELTFRIEQARRTA
ncbi:hypothetical protein [Micromonospora craniellae]|uniref:XRE family transcriptional regulator n=1 Tax=Micromonospora craniellae TaxID=2294034 RepID=A0A372G1R2_9ACTN|nr:hypothetical protein [Micromonospora craniellae]QOC89846.1 hypothetical protein ID554_16545 [Micromonospora craniellae]RFS46995.1 hypothetical protein D0Q02_07480 [Micromonospora craniellae]